MGVGGTGAVTFPGVNGNYIEVLPTNLLDADTAHTYQSIGKWRGSGFPLTPTQFAEPLAYSGTAINSGVTINPGGTSFFIADENIASNPFPASSPITGIVTVRAKVALNNIRFNVEFFDGTDSQDGVVSSGAISMAAGQVHTFVATGNTIASTAKIRPVVRVGTSEADADIDVWDLCVRADNRALFVPSFYIVGALDARYDLAHDATPAADMTLGGVMSGSSARTFAHIVTTAGPHRHRRYDGVSTVFGPSAMALAPSPVDDVRYILRHTHDPDVPEWFGYVDEVQAGTSAAAGTPGHDGAALPLRLGANGSGGITFAGKMWGFELKDGINGPIAVSSRFGGGGLTNGPIPDGHTSVDGLGQTWVVRGTQMSVEGVASGYLVPVYSKDRERKGRFGVRPLAGSMSRLRGK